jgi:iron complex outermembrane receptor protein
MKKLSHLLLLLIAASPMFAQNILKGKISDENGKALFSVSVYEKGTTNAVMTDFEGNYSIKYSSNATIIFSLVGYEKQEVAVDGKTELNITLKQGVELKAAEIVGSRRLNRTATETAVPVDIIDVKQLANGSGQLDVNQMLQYVVPSFNSNKQSGSDGADHIDPATLRGLGPDQTLVLINGKRRHQSALVNIFGTRGRGNTGTDMNTIPVSAIDHIEVLRDGASAQYGSDAIAGVVNIVLKKATDEFSAGTGIGIHNAKPAKKYGIKSGNDYDGAARQFNANYGFKLGEGGFLNATIDYLKTDHTNRAPDPAVYPEIYRRQFGEASQENFTYWLNSEFSAGNNVSIYAFGGLSFRNTDAFAFTRYPDEERNVLAIYPDGFDPRIQSVISDKSFSMGAKTKVKNWNLDVNNTIGVNRFHYFVDNTLNASMLEKSPTRFDAGGFQQMQNTTGLHLTRLFDKILNGLNVAVGTEYRIENYLIFAGQEESYKNYGGLLLSNVDSTGIPLDTVLRPGGSQGFPGFQPGDVINETRTNIGLYAEGEIDITKKLLVSAAGRFERYSDFGNTTNGKLAARFKITDWLSVRASASSGFRAPSLAQLYFNSTFSDVVAGNIIDKVIARNSSTITRALGIPKLKQEKSTNYSGGITARYKAFSLTLDGYYVKIDGRIVLTGAFDQNDDVIGSDLEALNISAAQFFTNAVNTTTKGVDAIATYSLLLNDNTLRFSLAGNFNDMTIDKVYTNQKLAGKENIYFGLRERYFLLASAPKSKMTFGVNYTMGNFLADVRLNQFGKVELINFNDNLDNVVDPGELDSYKPKMTIDLSLGYKFKNLQLNIGTANLLNTYPDLHDPALSESGGNWDAVQMGFAGAYYYAKLAFKF